MAHATVLFASIEQTKNPEQRKPLPGIGIAYPTYLITYRLFSLSIAANRAYISTIANCVNSHFESFFRFSAPIIVKQSAFLTHFRPSEIQIFPKSIDIQTIMIYTIQLNESPKHNSGKPNITPIQYFIFTTRLRIVAKKTIVTGGSQPLGILQIFFSLVIRYKSAADCIICPLL